MTGIELVAQERKEQIEKHGRTIELDKKFNYKFQLTDAVLSLTQPAIEFDDLEANRCPDDWEHTIWNKMLNKPYKERLIIAAALLCAEIDRIS